MNAKAAIWKRFAHVVTGLAVLLGLASPLFGALPIAHAAGPYVVDTSTDGPDSLLTDGLCSDGVDGCSLRAAIQQATHDGLATTITFGSDLAGSVLQLDNAYGTLLWDGDAITVNGEAKNITISGVNLASGRSVFKIEGNNNLLENLKIKLAPQDGIEVGDFAGTGAGNGNTVQNVTVFSNGQAGIYIFGGSSSGGQNNTVSASLIGAISALAGCGAGNHIGINVDQTAGTIVSANAIVCNMSHGVQVSHSLNVSVSSNNIGIDGASDPRPNGGDGVYAVSANGLTVQLNSIAGNGLNGILFQDSAAGWILGNMIGMDLTGAHAVPNGGNGLALTLNSDHNTIGDNLLGDRNIIGGNAGSGVLLDGSGAHDNNIAGNYLGTNLAGSAAIANGQNGVRLLNGAHNNVVGGGTAALRNVISGNSQAGVLIDAAKDNGIRFNLIGLNAAGTSALANGQEGVWIENGSTGNDLGNGSLLQEQYISGNAGSGVLIQDSDGNSVHASNRIGIGPTGNAIGNGDTGVLVIDAANNLIDPAIVANNAGAGVAAIGNSSIGNFLSPFGVYGNTGLPVDLGLDGPTPNDGVPDIGPDNFLDYPVITASAGHVLTGTVCGGCAVYVYSALGNPAWFGGGGNYVQTFSADGLGHWSGTLMGGLTKLTVSLQTSDGSNTSEMSPRPILFLPVVRR